MASRRRGGPGGAQPSPFRLRILEGPEAGAEYALTGATVGIGRGGDNDIILDDARCSRNHAQLVWAGGHYVLKDLGSRNGVLVSGKRVTERRLSEGDVFRVGGTDFQFYRVGGKPVLPVGASKASGIPPIAFVIGGALILLALGVIFMGAGDSTPTAEESVKGFEVAALSGGLEKRGGNRAQGLAVKRDADTRGAVNPPVDSAKQREAKDAFEAGERARTGKRWLAAKRSYNRALELDPSCERCRAQLEYSTAQLQGEIRISLDAGELYMATERWSEAIETYEQVLLMAPDENSADHQMALRQISKAKKASK